MMTDVEAAGDQCKYCTNEDGTHLLGKKHVELQNGDQIYLCRRCNRLWGVDKNGERIEKHE